MRGFRFRSIPNSDPRVACSRLSDGRDDALVKGTQKYESVIVLVLSQFRGSDYLGAWNGLPGETATDRFRLYH